MEAKAESIISVLLSQYGTTFAEDAAIELSNEPSPLFCLLCLTLLYSTRINAGIATDAAKAIFARG